MTRLVLLLGICLYLTLQIGGEDRGQKRAGLFLVITMRLLGSERWWLNMAVSAVALGLIYLVFRTAFSVILPVGRIWQGVL